MPDLTAGTQLATNASGFSRADLESASYVIIPGGTVAVRNAGEHASSLGTITVAIGKSAGTLVSPISGLVRRITQTTPALTGTGTATTELLDSSGGTIIGLAAQDESVITSYGTVEPINTGMSWVSTTSGTGQVSAVGVVVHIHYDL